MIGSCKNVALKTVKFAYWHVCYMLIWVAKLPLITSSCSFKIREAEMSCKVNTMGVNGTSIPPFKLIQQIQQLVCRRQMGVEKPLAHVYFLLSLRKCQWSASEQTAPATGAQWETRSFGQFDNIWDSWSANWGVAKSKLLLRLFFTPSLGP